MKNNRIVLVIGAFIIVIALVASVRWGFKGRNVKNGTVIILNGPSAAGKSSIQKAFQTMMMLQPSHEASADRPQLWIKLGIDNLFDGPLPDITLENLAYWQSQNPIRWVESSQDADQNNVITLFIGEEGERVMYGMNSAIAAYARNGCNVIVDYIAYKKEYIDDLQTKLKGITTCWVKVNIPLEVLEEREVARGTSPKGHARSHYHTVFWNVKYNLEVDTSTQTAIAIAQEIRNHLGL